MNRLKKFKEIVDRMQHRIVSRVETKLQEEADEKLRQIILEMELEQMQQEEREQEIKEWEERNWIARWEIEK